MSEGSTQTIDSRTTTFPKLALTLACPPCARTRTYVLDSTIQLILRHEWQSVSVVAECHCGYRTSVVLGWHDTEPGYTGRPVALDVGAWVVFDDAGICNTRGCAVKLNWWACPVCGEQGHGMEAHPNIAKETP